MEISLEDFSAAIAAIHAAAESPDRWPDAFSAVAHLVKRSEGGFQGDGGRQAPSDFDLLRIEQQMVRLCEPSARRVLALLAPHIETARQVQRRLAEALPGRLALAGLDRLTVAAFMLDAAGAVHHLNASARNLLAEDRCVRIRNSQIRFSERAWNVAFQVALRRATQRPSRSSLLPLSSGREDLYEVTVSPLQGDQASPAPCPGPLALVVIALTRLDAQRIAQRVRLLYGLTEAEARVMAALTSGGTVEGIALAHGVCISTVRAQVRSIFEKTGVNRQSDLVRLALAGAPLFTGPS